MAVTLAFAALALAGLLLSEKLHVWTEVLLESSAGVQHRKAVLAVRRGEYQKAIEHFEAALAGRAGRAAWLDYAAALAKAGRPADLLRLTKRMPDEARSHPEVLAAVAHALVEIGEDDAVPGALARLLAALGPAKAQRFEQALHERRFGDAARALREALQEDPERTTGLTRLLVGALQRGAVARARAGEHKEALAVLEDLVAGKDPEDPSSAAVEADRLVVLCWSGQVGRAIDGFLGLPAGSDAPEYVLDALVSAWGASEATLALPDDTLSRLLARTRPDVAASLIADCRSSRQLSYARDALPSLLTGPSERDARRLGLRIDRQLAVLWARDGRHAEAVELLRSVIGRDPADEAARADLVTILSWAGRHADAAREGAALEGKGLHDYAQRALEHSRAALERERVERRRAELHRKAVECARAGKFPEALGLIAQASAGSRSDAIDVDRAVILSWAGRHNDAVAAFKALTKSAPRPPYLLAALASSYNAVGRPDLALALWREVLGNDPKDLVAQEAVLTALLDAERWSDVRALLDWLSTRQVPTGPLRARLAHRKAVLAGRQGQIEAALEGLEGSARELQGDPRVAWDRIALLSWSGRHWEAIEAFESLAAPAEAPAYVQIEAAEAYRASYRAGAAFALYAALLARDRDDAIALRGIRSLLSERADWFFEPGLRRLAEDSEPPPPWLREHRWEDGRNGDAIAAARRGDRPEALRALRSALEAPGWDPRSLRDSLVLLSLSGRFPEVAVLFRALSTDGEGLEWLASAALGATGHTEEALALSLAWCDGRPRERGACSEAVHRLLRLERVAEASGLLARLPLVDAQRVEADLLLHQGRAVEASARYEEALKRSKEPEALLGLSVALSLQGREAQAPARAALEQLPVGEYLLHHALTPDAAVALARVLNGLRRPAAARAALEPLLADQPENTHALLALGQALELQQERLEAAQAYGRLLRISPGDRHAAESRDRVLLQLAATGSPGSGRGTSESPGLARAPRSVEDRARATLASLQGTWASGVVADEAALSEAANAHLDLEEHKQALALLQTLAERIEQRGGAGRAEHTEAKLAQVRCLVRLLEFERAGQILDALERELPLFVHHRGTQVPNWDRADVEVERGWWLLAQDRLSEAESHFARMLSAAPLSAAARSGLAHTHLLRGWPRLARTELQEAAEQHPQDGDIKVGLAQALQLTRDPEGAQRIAETLSASSPDNRYARELMGAMRIASLSEIWASAAADLRFADTEGLSAAFGFRTPVGIGRLTLQADVTFKREESAGSVDRTRASVGARAEILPELALAAQASANPFDRRWGVAATLEYEPTDRLAFHLQGDSDSWALPPGAMRAGVTGRELAAGARYRRDETFEAAADLRGLALNDGNRILEGEARVQLQLAATGRWRSTLGVEAAAEGSRRSSLLYFSPPRTLSAVLVPELEHVWWRSRRYTLSERVGLSAGLAHEDGWGLGERLALDYEQRHALWDRWELMLQAGISRRRYEGTPELGWRLALGSRLRF